MENKKKIFPSFILPAIIFVCVAAAIISIFVLNEYSLVLSIPEETIYLEYGVDSAPEVTALCQGTILSKEGTPVSITADKEIDLNTLGTYEVSYSAEYRWYQLSATRTYIVQDTIAPVIELVSDPEHFTSPVGKYEEEGFQATDNHDGDITSQVISEENNGVVTYTVSDSSGNKTSIDRIIIYKDVIPPIISLKNGNTINLATGKIFTDPGFSASDDVDGDITSLVTVDGSVNIKKAGTYTLTYRVQDSSGNVFEIKRTVNVGKHNTQTPADTDNNANTNANIPDGPKYVYLTFDDGPGAHTARLLDILDKYGVKATFFVTNQFPDYQYLIGEAYRRGHTIALHTATHNYSIIYSSEEAYYNDLQTISDICVTQAGIAPKLVRFPGGTSNSVSKKYGTKIMSTLSKSLLEKGYYYTDWNVDCKDTAGATTAKAVANNVIAGIKNRSVSNVLMHDIKGYSVDAVDQIISWGLEHGYTFLAMDENSPMPRFTPKN